MIKNFTLFSLKYFKKAILLAAIVLLFVVQKDFAGSRNFDGNVLQVKTIKCYPNPAISFVNFEFPLDYITKGYALQVYSFTGKKMYESPVTSVKSTITFSTDFYRGIYIYQLQDKSGKILETGKFQVNR